MGLFFHFHEIQYMSTNIYTGKLNLARFDDNTKLVNYVDFRNLDKDS